MDISTPTQAYIPLADIAARNLGIIAEELELAELDHLQRREALDHAQLMLDTLEHAERLRESGIDFTM